MTGAHITKGNLDRHIQGHCHVKMKTDVRVILLNTEDISKTLSKPVGPREEAGNQIIPGFCCELDLGLSAFRNVRN